MILHETRSWRYGAAGEVFATGQPGKGASTRTKAFLIKTWCFLASFNYCLRCWSNVRWINVGEKRCRASNAGSSSSWPILGWTQYRPPRQNPKLIRSIKYVFPIQRTILVCWDPHDPYVNAVCKPPMPWNKSANAEIFEYPTHFIETYPIPILQHCRSDIQTHHQALHNLLPRRVRLLRHLRWDRWLRRVRRSRNTFLVYGFPHLRLWYECASSINMLAR